jgi:aryl-phospho-beta-D-glucosidase BglC (GH1 family)
MLRPDQGRAGDHPYVDSNGQLRDGSGNPIYLRGAMIDSNLAYYSRWPAYVMDLVLTATTFQKMHDVWGMNAVRLDISYWLWEDDPGDGMGHGGTYRSDLETIIGLANDYGLYVVLDFHNDAKAEGSSPTLPAADGMLHQSEVNWWITLATQTQNTSNTMLIFDLINEPQYGSWGAWCEGSSNKDPSCKDSGDIVGFPDAIGQMRTAGVQQPIVVEPGDAAKQGSSQDSGWQNYNTGWISDPDILYSKHDYGEITKAQVQDPTTYQSQWDAEWGPLMNSQGQHSYALYYGE